MRITSLTLTNFRSFKNSQKIDLAPITLLFGPNSVGKSSILMAMAYVQQILSKGHCDPKKIDALGDKFVGGFRSLVNGQDLNKNIKIRMDYDSELTPFTHYDEGVDELSNQVFSMEYPMMKDFGGETNTGAVEFEISWSHQYQRAYVKNYRVWANNRYVGCISSSEDQKSTNIVELNTQHPLLVPENHMEWLDLNFDPEKDKEVFKDDEFQTEFEIILSKLNRTEAVEIEFDGLGDAGEAFVNRISPIGLRCNSGAIPLLGMSVVTNLSGQDFDDTDSHLQYLVVRQALSQAFVLPLDQVLRYLEKSAFIGPLRIVPGTDYSANPYPEQRDWANGSAAWDFLYKDPNYDEVAKDILDKTNKWISSKDKLNTGYEIVNKSILERYGVSIDNISSDYSLLKKRHVLFKETSTGNELEVGQLGVGVSQVLPVVVAAAYNKITLSSIEQPELHIHPRLQVELADIFIESSKSKSFIIETHSEHIILRLLKRIRQSTDNELPEGLHSLDKEDISIIYLDESESGVRAERIHIDEDGEFQQKWPNGFFAERREELM